MIVIDPGAAGGIVTVGKAFTAISMPKTEREICDAIRAASGISFPEGKTAYLEDLVKFTGRNMPSSSMATYAGNWGFLKGCLTAFEFRIILVPPKKWQKALGLGGSAAHPSQTAWKNHLKNRAEQLFPHIKVTHATADALLIYEAARQGHLG
jgi:hypothetical protein